MAEIPLLTDSAQTENPTQAVDTRDSRLMGDAVAKLGDAMFDYGNMLAKNARQVKNAQAKLDADEAEDLLREALIKARAQERAQGEMEDSSGLNSWSNVRTAVKPVEDDLMERLTPEAKAIFKSRKAGVYANAAPETLAMAVKGNATLVKAKMEKSINKLAELATLEPVKMSEYQQRAAIRIEEMAEAGLIPRSDVEMETNKALAHIAMSTAEDLKSKGMYEEAKHVISANRELLSKDEADKQRIEIDQQWARDINIQESSLRLTEKRLEMAKEEKFNSYAAAHYDRLAEAGNDIFKLEAAKQDVLAQMKKDPMTFTREKVDALLASKNPSLTINDDRQELLWVTKFIAPGRESGGAINFKAAANDLFKRNMTDATRTKLLKMLRSMEEENKKDPLFTKMLDLEMDRIAAQVDADWSLADRFGNENQIKMQQIDRMKELLLRANAEGRLTVDSVRKAGEKFKSSDMPTYQVPSAPITQGAEQLAPEAIRKQMNDLGADLQKNGNSMPRSMLKQKMDEMRKLENLLTDSERNARLKGQK